MYQLVAVSQLRALAAWSLAGVVLCLAGMALAIATHAGAAGVLTGAVLGLALGSLPGLALASARTVVALPSAR